MKVWLKRVLIGLVVAFLVALVGVAIFLLTFDPNAYKNKLQEIVYARYARTLNINGDIELSLFPRIGLAVQDVTLSDRGSSDLFASMDSARLAVAIWPLMFNRLVVDHVAVTGFQAWVVKDEEGDFNFDDLLSRHRAVSLPAHDLGSPLKAIAGTVNLAQAAVAAATTGSTASASESQEVVEEQPSEVVIDGGEHADLQIDIAGLTLRNGQIHLHDKKRGYVGHITNLEVNTGRMTADQPFDLAFRGRLLGDFPSADARFDGQALVRFNTDQKNYSAQRVNVQMNGLLGNLQARSLGLKGSLAYSVYSQMFSASGLDFAVQGEVTGPDPVKDLEATLTVPRLKLDRSQAELHVEKLSLRAKGARPDETFELGLDAPNLAVSPDSASGEPLTATMQLQGKNERLAMVLGMSGLAGNASQLSFKELKLDGRMQQGEQQVQVKMTSPGAWHVFQEKGNLSAMRGDVRIEHPALPGGVFEFPFIGSVAADMQKDHIRSELDAVLSGSKLGFRVGVQRTAERPQVDFSLHADQLDFNTLFPAASRIASPGSPAAEAERKEVKEQSAEKTAELKPPAQAPTPETARAVSLAFLNDIDLTGKMDVGALKVQQVEAGDFHAELRAVDGKLTVKDLRAELYGGRAVGSLVATADNTVSLDINAAEIAVEPLLMALTGDRKLTGTGNLRAKLDSKGQTMPALMAALNGSAQLQIRDGAVRGIDAAQTLRQVQDIVRSVTKGEAGSVSVNFDAGTETTFSRMDTELRFKNGQGTLHKLDVVSPAVRVTHGKPASIDLVNQQLNVLVNLRVSGSAQDTHDLMALRGVTVPLQVTGPFKKPAYQVQWKDIAGVAVREAVKSGLLELLGSQLESAVPGTPVPEQAAPSTPAPSGNKDPVRAIGDALKGLLGQ